MSDDEEDTIIFDETQYDNDLISKEDSNYFYENYNIKNNKSSNILSKYEKTKVIFERIQLIVDLKYLLKIQKNIILYMI